jgi:hypothetical protein
MTRFVPKTPVLWTLDFPDIDGRIYNELCVYKSHLEIHISILRYFIEF